MRGQRRNSSVISGVVKRKIVTERKFVSEVRPPNMDTKYRKYSVSTRGYHIESTNMIRPSRAETSLNSLQNARIGQKTERAFQMRKDYANERHAFT